MDPFIENMNVSSFMHSRTSCIHLAGIGCFHLRRMARLANRVVNARTCCVVLGIIEVEGRPNVAVGGLGSIGVLRAQPSHLNTCWTKSLSGNRRIGDGL